MIGGFFVGLILVSTELKKFKNVSGGKIVAAPKSLSVRLLRSRLILFDIILNLFCSSGAMHVDTLKELELGSGEPNILKNEGLGHHCSREAKHLPVRLLRSRFKS